MPGKKSILSKYLSKIGRRGGKSRWASLAPEERSAIARKGAEAANKVKAAKRQESRVSKTSTEAEAAADPKKQPAKKAAKAGKASAKARAAKKRKTGESKP